MSPSSSFYNPLVGQPFILLKTSITLSALQNIICSYNTPSATHVSWVHYLLHSFFHSQMCTIMHSVYVSNLGALSSELVLQIFCLIFVFLSYPVLHLQAHLERQKQGYTNINQNIKKYPHSPEQAAAFICGPLSPQASISLLP